jgi:hypothetical protein
MKPNPFRLTKGRQEISNFLWNFQGLSMNSQAAVI